MGNQTVQVLLPVAVDTAFDYAVPEGMAAKEGAFVKAPFGPRTMKGVVWETGEGQCDPEKVKPLFAKVGNYTLKPSMKKFIDWVADYTVSPVGSVFAMVMSVPDALEPPAPLVGYRLGKNQDFKRTAAREKVLKILHEGAVFTQADLAREAGVTPSVIKGLEKLGAIQQVEFTLPEPDVELDLSGEKKPQLSSAQQTAADNLVGKVTSGEYSTTVLDGVTGSGKTEVYFEAIRAALEDGKQALVLLPEIVLTTQLIARFKERFGFAPTEWHSGLTQAARRHNWRLIASGKARLIIGARSALFLPYPELGVIIVDEEHENAYKQEEGVIYHGRDMAVVRARIEEIPVVLVSATPSLETVTNVEQGKYDQVHLPERHGGAVLPKVEVVDMRSQEMDAQHWLSQDLKEAMAQNFAREEQVLLFLNRRGYAPLTLCRACGYRFECPDCSAWLVEHKIGSRCQVSGVRKEVPGVGCQVSDEEGAETRNPKPETSLHCHHCGYSTPMPKTCLECEAEESLVACGPGVQRLEEEVRECFPEARIVTMTSDTIINAATARETVAAIMEGRADVIIGTQMVTKGHHFPNLTLVGIIDADLGLEGGDLRAGEKTYQLLHQVAGRAGREGKPGRALVQSYVPEHPVMQALIAGDRDQFLVSEKTLRELAKMPPFARLAAIILSGKNEARVKQVAGELARVAPRGEGVDILGPAPAPMSLLRGNYRYRLLVRTTRNIHIQKLVRSWLEGANIPSSVRCKVDIDPHSFM